MSKEVVFSRASVEDWCDENDDKISGESVFGQPVVPSMMLLNPLSSMIRELFSGEVILAGVTAARFRDPVLMGETVTYSLDDVEQGQNMTTVEFDARVEERGSLVAKGVLSLARP